MLEERQESQNAIAFQILAKPKKKKLTLSELLKEQNYDKEQEILRSFDS
jgi:hypothetical protein